MTHNAREGIEEITFKDDGYRVTAYKNGEELGIVTEYKHSEYGHLFPQFLHHQLQKAQEAWFKKGYEDAESVHKDELQKAREEERERAIQVMRNRQIGWLGQEEDGSDRHPFYDEIQTIIDRYQSELDQDKK